MTILKIYNAIKSVVECMVFELALDGQAIGVQLAAHCKEKTPIHVLHF